MEKKIIKFIKPNIHDWLCKNIHKNEYSDNVNFIQDKFILVDNKINANTCVVLINNVTRIKYPFGVVKGNFHCGSSNYLETLIGCPEIVESNFYCYSSHKLKTLEGAPKHINGDFECDMNNSLINLEGGPKYVGRNYDVSNCYNLKNLIGCSKYVGGYFSCVDCENLTSFKGLPIKVDGDVFLDNGRYNIMKFSPYSCDGVKYNKYVDMWFELLESVSDDEKIEYINNYKDKVEHYSNSPLIPKEVINKYKIDFLLKE